MKKIDLFLPLVMICLLMVCCDVALARDLNSAVRTYSNTVKTIAQALSATGVLAGGCIMQIPGAGDVGKRVATLGIIGSGCAFGGPIIISAMQNWFGTGMN